MEEEENEWSEFTMVTSWKFWLMLVTVGMIIWLLAYGFTTDPKFVPSPLVGKPAPDFTITRLGGTDQLRLSDLRGKPVVLNFWASWCYACREEAYIFKMAYNRHEVQERHIRVVGIAIQDTEAKALEFAERYGKEYFLALDELDGDISLNYGIYGVPETFFITSEGIIQYKHVGAVTEKVMDIELAILLNQPAGVEQ